MLKNGVQKCICLEHPISSVFSSDFVDFGCILEGPGPQKNTKNSKTLDSNRFRDALGARLGFGYDFGSDIERLLTDFRRILEIFKKILWNFDSFVAGF